jgi:SAM-dependent methyltransferase
MLEQARHRAGEASREAQERLTLAQGDMRTWQAPAPFDLIVTPCSSLCHLIALEDQLAAWRQAYANLAPGGRFVVDVSMPNLAAYADSFTTPPRMMVEIDRDRQDPETGARLLRYRTLRYLPHEQRAEVRFLYDRFEGEKPPERYVSDYQSHVYFPRELQLLFLHTGFEVEAVYGGYRQRALSAQSRQLIVVGRRP